MTKQTTKSIESLVGVVAAEVLLDAVETSQRLTALGVPHALVGGLAVGLHGHPRATKDVDFLVGWEAFERTHPFLIYREELKALVSVGEVDLIALPLAYPVLANALKLAGEGEIPVLSLEGLLVMKLSAGRPQDLADVHALLPTGDALQSVVQFFRVNAPDLLHKLLQVIP